MRCLSNLRGFLVGYCGLLIASVVECMFEAQDEPEFEPRTRPISDFIRETDYTLSLSKDWALKFDEEIGRGDYLTEDKQMEIHNNLLEVAEILHIIPEGSASRYSELLLKEGHGTQGSVANDGSETTEISKLLEYHSELSVDLPTLRRHGITNNFVRQASQHLHGSFPQDGNVNDLGRVTSSSSSSTTKPTQDQEESKRKYSPRLAMHSSSTIPSSSSRI